MVIFVVFNCDHCLQHELKEIYLAITFYNFLRGLSRQECIDELKSLGKTQEYRKQPRIFLGGGVARPLPYWVGGEISGARP